MTAKSARKSISKTVRFEVFKRDSFKCQYCGRCAPEVLLHVDHIKPVAEGGENELLNLLTACGDCNAGKGKRQLSDDSAVQKQRLQMEQLQERREQLEMMMEWQRGLTDLNAEAVDELNRYWEARAPGWTANEEGKRKLRTLLRKFTVAEICHAMNVAADQYLEFQQNGAVTQESWSHAFGKIGGVCRVEKETAGDPALKQLYLFRGILRKKFDDRRTDYEAMDLMKAALSWGVDVDEVRNVVNRSGWYAQFRRWMFELINEAKKAEGEEVEPPER